MNLFISRVPLPNKASSVLLQITNGEQCDQIGQFFWIMGNFSKPLATINLPKSFTFLGNFCKGVKIFNFSSEIIFGQLL